KIIDISKLDKQMNKFQQHSLESSIRLCSNNDFCYSLERDPLARRDVVILRSINERHNVSILFDSTGFSQIRQHRSLLTPAGLYCPAQLGKSNDWNSQFLGHSLECSGDGADFLFAGTPFFIVHIS